MTDWQEVKKIADALTAVSGLLSNWCVKSWGFRCPLNVVPDWHRWTSVGSEFKTNEAATEVCRAISVFVCCVAAV